MKVEYIEYEGFEYECELLRLHRKIQLWKAIGLDLYFVKDAFGGIEAYKRLDEAYEAMRTKIN